MQSRAVGDIDDCLMKLLLCSQIDPDIMPELINVLTLADRVDKNIEGFRQQYNRLSEYAHPNWKGTALLYCKPDPAKLMDGFRTEYP